MACVTRPAVEHLERSLKALQEAVAGRRADIAAKEAALAADNPPAFRALQACAGLSVHTPVGSSRSNKTFLRSQTCRTINTCPSGMCEHLSSHARLCIGCHGVVQRRMWGCASHGHTKSSGLCDAIARRRARG